jgi:hypothetical protein
MFQHRILSTVLTLTALTTSGLLGMPKPVQASEASAPTDRFLIAQSVPSQDGFSGNISVMGISQVNAPADRAILVLTYYPNSYYASTDYSDPNAANQTPQVLPSDLKTITDAVVAVGVPASDVKAYPDPSSAGSIRVRLLLAQPTQARVAQVVEAANTAATKSNRYTASGASVGYTINDCQSVENQARRAAMADAQARAAALAEVAGTEVGKIYSLSESVTWGSSYSSTCPASSDPTAYSDIYSLPMYDPSIPPMVKAIYSLNATYGMK